MLGTPYRRTSWGMRCGRDVPYRIWKWGGVIAPPQIRIWCFPWRDFVNAIVLTRSFYTHHRNICPCMYTTVHFAWVQLVACGSWIRETWGLWVLAHNFFVNKHNHIISHSKHRELDPQLIQQTNKHSWIERHEQRTIIYGVSAQSPRTQYAVDLTL